jgi:putative tryptophan/tyrosine transport system substrate-binding protein
VRRRQFIIFIGAAVVSPLAATAQPRAATIGVLAAGDAGPLLRELREELRRRGYVEGQNLHFEVRQAEGNVDVLRPLADELVRLNVDVIVARLTPAVQAAKAATQTIPIVMAPAGAPVETGLVASLARPGGNVTGFSIATAEVSGKRLEMIRDMVPAARRVAILVNPADPFAEPFVAETEQAAPSLGLEITPILVRGSHELAAAFATVASERADVAILQGSLPNKPAAEMALKQRLPLFGTNRPTVDAGALMSYSGQVLEAYSQAAIFVEKILKGAWPADLPVQQSTKFELIINLKTAKALGLTVPPTLLERADEVIE